jgi:uncharacterized repeat protein (TIGR03803 family)
MELVQDKSGDFFGTTKYGGISFVGSSTGFGTVFRVSTNGALTVLHLFTRTNEGAFPQGSLALGADGNYYGTADYGGAPGNNGSIFKISPGGVFTPISINFMGGSTPLAGLLLGEDGNFYGSTYFGNSSGTLFKVTSAGDLTKLLSFSGIAGPFPGASPSADMVRGSDGSFYGTTGFRGVNYLGEPTNNGWGSIYRLSIPIPPTFRSIVRSNGASSLAWSAVAEQKYQLQFKTNFQQIIWNNLGDVVTATNGLMSTTDSFAPDPKRFYRIVLLP